MEIRDHHVLITGSNRGIGRAVALMCAESKAHLHLVNRTQDPEFKDECLKAGALSVAVYDLDLSSKEKISGFINSMKEQEIDILFNNAGQLTGGLMEEQSIDEIYAMLQVNVNALIQLTHGFLPMMLKRKKGKIINHSSISGVMNLPCASTYSAAKAAVAAFTHCLQSELVGTGVSTLLLLTPGIETRMFSEIVGKYGKNFDVSSLGKGINPKKYAQMIREAILEDLEVLRPHGFTGISLLVAQHAPKVFNRIVATKFKR